MAKLTARDAADGAPLLKRIWREELSHYKPQLAAILGLIVLIAATTSLYPVLIKLAFDSFTNAQGSGAETLLIRLRDWLSGLTGGVAGPIHAIALLVVLATSIKGFSLLGQIILTNSVVSRIEADMQGELYGRLVEADLAQLQAQSAASLTQRFTTDFLYVREALTRLVNVAIRDGVTAICLFGAMLWIDWQLTLAAIVIVPLVAGPIIRIGKKLRRVSQDAQEQAGVMASLITESLQGARTAKTERLEPYLKQRGRDAFERIRKLRMKAINARGRVEPLLEVGGGFAVAVVLFAIGFRVNAGSGTVGDFTGYVTALLLAAQPLRSIGNLNAVVQEALASLKRFYATVDERPRIVEAPDAKPLAVSEGRVAFADVSFRYREDQPALEQVTLEAKPGTVTALVGRSGSGKSTLLALVPRLYDVTDGSVAIDGQDVRPSRSPRCASASRWSRRTWCCSTTRSAPTSPWPAFRHGGRDRGGGEGCGCA